MKISVFGLGYVGVVTAACLAHDGHQVVGVDVAQLKVDMINQGRSPLSEEGIDALVREGVGSGRLKATRDARQAVEESDMAIVCVGTPSSPTSGALDTTYVQNVTAEIGALLKTRCRPFLFVLRSTVVPGTTQSLIIPTLEEHAGRPVGEGYDVVFHPEFLREGTSIRDFYDPPKVVVGERVSGCGQPVFALYASLQAPQFPTSLEVAEAVKYADNAFHAVKITFANEMGQFCQAHNVDSREVMDIFCSDTKLNISPRYLRPGYAFGGSCLPKDLRALLHAAHASDLALPMFESVLPSNVVQIERVLGMVIAARVRNVGLVGLSFKPGTDDLRESPLVELAERLMGKGIMLRIWDDSVRVASLVGSNKTYIERQLPHLAEHLSESLDSLSKCDFLIVGHPVAEERLSIWLQQGIQVLDLVGSIRGVDHPNYRGVTW
jgi:GDP-mannose 6-dehydrogenase